MTVGVQLIQLLWIRLPGVPIQNSLCNNLLLLQPLILGPLACFPSELICNYGSYRLLVGILGRVISPIARPLLIQDSTNTEETRTDMPLVGLEPTIPVFKRAKTFHTLDRAATLIGLLC
jgi:hypothetical protein